VVAPIGLPVDALMGSHCMP